ncbi:hypothetical protein SDC9_202376 [bioreactor metagenome]|uniref:Uncharacterized protein n=1 Tax=bioreactor metagenome TaxID=1076179 RepID=A0A645IWA4_9ZZZZ
MADLIFLYKVAFYSILQVCFYIQIKYIDACNAADMRIDNPILLAAAHQRLLHLLIQPNAGRVAAAIRQVQADA